SSHRARSWSGGITRSTLVVISGIGGRDFIFEHATNAGRQSTIKNILDFFTSVLQFSNAAFRVRGISGDPPVVIQQVLYDLTVELPLLDQVLNRFLLGG